MDRPNLSSLAIRVLSVGRYRGVRAVFLSVLMIAVFVSFNLENVALAVEPSKAEAVIGDRVRVTPEFEAYIASGMKAFDVPGWPSASSRVTSSSTPRASACAARTWRAGRHAHHLPDRLDDEAFLATTLAIMVDRGKLHWDDRIVDLDPDFQLKDPWVTREFRVFDLLAQRSGLPPYANDVLGMLGLDETATDPLLAVCRAGLELPHDLRLYQHHSFPGRSDRREGCRRSGWGCGASSGTARPPWHEGVSYTAEAIIAADNHAEGYRWTADGRIEVPFTQIFPYDFGGAGVINSNIEDMAHWVRLQLGGGTLDGHRIVSPENLAYTRMPKVAITDKLFYALGWIVQQTRTATSSGITAAPSAFGAFVGMAPDKDRRRYRPRQRDERGFSGCDRTMDFGPNSRQS